MQIVGSTSWELLRLVCAKRDRLTKLKSSVCGDAVGLPPVLPSRAQGFTASIERPYDLPQSERLPRWSISSSDLRIRASKVVRTPTARPAAAAINLFFDLAVTLINVSLGESMRGPRRSELWVTAGAPRILPPPAAPCPRIREAFVASDGKGAAESATRSRFDLVQWN